MNQTEGGSSRRDVAVTFSGRSEAGLAETNAWTRARRAAGPGLLDLTGCNPTRAGFSYDGPAIRAALGAASALVYEPDPRGWRGAREALVEAGLAPALDRVFLTSSTSEAYGHLFTLLTDPGDEVLVPAPSYPLLSHLGHLAGVVLSPYTCRYDGRWSFEPAELWDAISDRTRAILAVSPNNPTGAYLSGDELEALASLGLPLIVDEVFHGYPIEAPRVRPRGFAAARESLVFTLDGASKSLALPQLKLGWMSVTGPEAQVEEACSRLDLILDTYLSVSTSQHALPALLREAARPGSVPAQIRARAATNLARLREVCRGTSATVPRVEGGFYASIRMPATQTDEAWAIGLIDEGVLVQPGYFYDFPEEQAWLVVSLMTPEEVFARGSAQVARLAR